jgi:hypothetical protein
MIYLVVILINLYVFQHHEFVVYNELAKEFVRYVIFSDHHQIQI